MQLEVKSCYEKQVEDLRLGVLLLLWCYRNLGSRNQSMHVLGNESQTPVLRELGKRDQEHPVNRTALQSLTL